ncbi:Peptidyl-prolyl cis-trans isomerase pin4, partial [Spiromyces aspiralis]
MPTAIEEALKKLEGTHLTDRSSVGSRASSSPIDGGAISEGRESDLQARRRSRVPNINVHGAPDIAGGRPRAHTNVNNQHARYSAIYSHPVLSPQPLTGAELALMANMPSDAIPNAIVVKNINFAIKREELLQTITDLGLPLPYAFNYHYEGGVFRGLAFGNFRTAEEAARVIVGLNGVTMLGRTIKVEYKKALPGMTPAECMSRHQPPPPVPTTTYTSHPSSVTFHHDQVSHHYNHQEWQDQAASNKDEIGSQAAEDTSSVEQRDEGVQQQQSTDPAFKSASRDGAAGTVRPRRDTASRMRPQSMLVGSAMQVHAEERPAVTIDLDDKDTRLLYDLISQFRHDKSMVELEFPSALSEHQRQCAIAIAGRFGLKYEVKGAGNHRYIRVYKGLETLLEATEVKRRSGVRGGGGQYGMGVPSTVGRGQLPRSTSGANFQGTAGGGRQRPVSAVFDNFQGGWDPSLVSNRVSMFHQSHFDRQAYHHSPHHHQYDDVGQAYINPSTNSYDTAGQSATIAPTTGLGLGVPSRGRSLTNAQQA